ncbi:MAG: acyl-CoA dehydrogenase family protein [Proteobacteria bacterium]|nr:acyl-CoA dehydrogenase family protein [Pseudomonadota bacterium]
MPEILHRLDELAAMFRDSAAEGDRRARLPKAVVRALVQHGLFRLWIPRRCGGFELGLPEALRIYEAAARLDGSIGWAVMIGSGGGLFAAYLDPATAISIYARPESVIAGSGAPDGRALREKGGYRVNGCWRYASGAHYATTFTANCLVMDGGTLVTGSDGKPLIRAMAFEPSQVTILQVWGPTGMRGTGSEDFEVRDAFVPESRSFSLSDAPRETGPLYLLPFNVLTVLPVTAVAVGIARHALDLFSSLAHVKKVHGTGDLLMTDPVVQATFGAAHAIWQQGKSTLDTLAHKAWDSARADRPLAPTDLAEITSGCVFSVAKIRQAIAELMALTGMTAIQPGSELARAWRDYQALAAHGSVSPRHLGAAGAQLLDAGA